MSSGFNTDVRIGDRVFHVQTEDCGPARPVIDTVIYQNGQILHRRASSYEEFLAAPQFSPESLRERVEAHHRSVIESLRAGALDAEIATAIEQSAQTAGIEITLLNPGSWLSAGNVSLSLEIVRRSDRQPEPGASVEAMIEGALRESLYAGTSDEQGRTVIEFPLPPLGKGDLALVIQATARSTRDEIRFSMRSKTPPAAPAG